MDAIFKRQKDISLGIFIDIKKAFDTVDHRILIRKLQHYGFEGVELELLKNYLVKRYQYTDIDGFISEFAEILAGVPQGSVLGPLLFLIYINDFPCATNFQSFLFADDTSLFMSGNNLKSLQIQAQAELYKVEEWFKANKMQLNSKKTRFIVFNLPKVRRSEPFTIEVDGEKLVRVSEEAEEKSVRLVGVKLDEELSFKYHAAEMKAKLSRVNYVLARSKNELPLNVRVLIYNSLVRSVMEFPCVLYGAAKAGVVGTVEKVQKKIIRNVIGARYRAHTNEIFLELGFLKFRDMVEYNQRVLGHKICYSTLPLNIRSDFSLVTGRETRAMKNMNLKVPFCSKRLFETAPCLTIPTAWNNLDKEIKIIEKVKPFKNKLRKSYFDKYQNEPKCSSRGCYSCTGSSQRS